MKFLLVVICSLSWVVFATAKLSFREFVLTHDNSVRRRHVNPQEHASQSQKRAPAQLFIRVNGRELKLRRVDTNSSLSPWNRSTAFTERDGKRVELEVPSFEQRNLYFYRSSKRDAILAVRSTQHSDGTFKRSYEGFLTTNGRTFFITPAQRSVKRRQLHEVHLLRRNSEPIDHMKRIERKLRKRGSCSGNFYVELLAFVDHDLYNKFNKDMEQITYYMAHVIFGIDMRYENIQASSWKVYVRLAGIHVATSRSDSLEQSVQKSFEGSECFMKNQNALTAIKTWAFTRYNQSPKFDHAMFFTGCDLETNSGSRSVAGYAPVNAICSRYGGQSQGASVVEAAGGFGSINIGAHELGHNLGAFHDDPEANGCSGESNYVMAASNAQVTEDNLQNPWHFSSCSINAFQQSCSDGEWSCLQNEADHYITGSEWEEMENKYPGTVYTLDEQCRQIYGADSGYCEIGEPCQKLWCKKPGTIGTCTTGGSNWVARGSYCGPNKWCIKAKCVYDSRAPSADPSGNTDQGDTGNTGGSNTGNGGGEETVTEPSFENCPARGDGTRCDTSSVFTRCQSSGLCCCNSAGYSVIPTTAGCKWENGGKTYMCLRDGSKIRVKTTWMQ